MKQRRKTIHKHPKNRNQQKTLNKNIAKAIRKNIREYNKKWITIIEEGYENI